MILQYSYSDIFWGSRQLPVALVINVSFFKYLFNCFKFLEIQTGYTYSLCEYIPLTFKYALNNIPGDLVCGLIVLHFVFTCWVFVQPVEDIEFFETVYSVDFLLYCW